MHMIKNKEIKGFLVINLYVRLYALVDDPNIELMIYNPSLV